MAIVHSTEEQERVVHAMMVAATADDERDVKTSRSRGHFGNEILVCSIAESDKRNADKLLEGILERLSERDKRRINDELVTRLDKSGTLHLRLDKQEAYQGKLSLADEEPIKVEFYFKPRAGPGLSLVEAVKARIDSQSGGYQG